MAKTKLNTDLDKSAKKIKKTSDDEDVAIDPIVPIDDGAIGDDGYPTEVSPEEDDDTTYTMGEIQVSDNDAAEEVVLKKAPNPDSNDDDDDVEWVDEEVNMKDEDPYLDKEDFDMDNPYGDDDNDSY